MNHFNYYIIRETPLRLLALSMNSAGDTFSLCVLNFLILFIFVLVISF